MDRLRHHPGVAEAVEIDRVAIRVQELDGLRITQPATRRPARPAEPGPSSGGPA